MKKNNTGTPAVCKYGVELFISVFFLMTIFGAARADQGERPYFTDIGQFNYAKFLMNEQDYKAAAREFARLIEHFPASPLIEATQFSLAEAYYRAGMYKEAEAELNLFLHNFEDSPFEGAVKSRMSDVHDRVSPQAKPETVSPPPSYAPRPRGLKAVQVMFFEGKSYAEIDDEMRRLKDEGVDTIIARVFHNPGDRFYPSTSPRAGSGVYFKTGSAPVVEDILGDFTDIAHKNGLRIFAWMTTRYADYGIEGRGDLACGGCDIASLRPSRCKGIDLFNEEAVSRLERIYSDLAGYDIDGILFQDDLVLRHNEGFGEKAAALFASETGSSLDPQAMYIRQAGTKRVHYTGLFWKWSSWKNKRLLFVAERLKNAVREKKPDVKFALNLMYESVTNPPWALAWLSQDLKSAMNSGFDYYSIMAYHRQMEEELEERPEAVKDLIGRMVVDASDMVREPHKVLIKLQTIDWRTGEPLSDDEVLALIREIKGIRDVSIALVPYRKEFPFRALGGDGLAFRQ